MNRAALLVPVSRDEPGHPRRYRCHESYRDRYRVAALASDSPDSSGGNLGYRTVAGL